MLKEVVQQDEGMDATEQTLVASDRRHLGGAGLVARLTWLLVGLAGFGASLAANVVMVGIAVEATLAVVPPVVPGSRGRAARRSSGRGHCAEVRWKH